MMVTRRLVLRPLYGPPSPLILNIEKNKQKIQLVCQHQDHFDEQINEQTNKQMNKQTNEQANEQTDEQPNK